MKKLNYKEIQRKYREMAKPKFYPKGTKVTFIKHLGRKLKDEERELPNADGSHFVGIGSKLAKVNRQRAHQRAVDRMFTKRGRFVVEVAKDKDGKLLIRKDGKTIKSRTPRHQVNPHTFELPYAPSLTNHQRMKLREEERNARKKVPAKT